MRSAEGAHKKQNVKNPPHSGQKTKQMLTEAELQQLAESGKKAFKSKSYLSAAETYGSAAQGYAEQGDDLLAAEMKNNQSVALLQAGKTQEALDATRGTESVFAGANDKRRSAMALGNQAAALEALNRLDEALTYYERSADLFAQAGEGDLRSTVLQSAAAIKLKRGRLTESGFKMIGALEAKSKPSFFERILRFFLRRGL